MSSVDRPSGGPQWHTALRARGGGGGGGGGMRISFAKKDGASSGGSSPTGTTPVAVDPNALGLDAERRYEEARARIFGSADEEAMAAAASAAASSEQLTATFGPAHRDGSSDFVGFIGRQGYDDDFARGTHIWAGGALNGPLTSPPMQSPYSNNAPYMQGQGEGDGGGGLPSAMNMNTGPHYPSPLELHTMLSALLFAPGGGGGIPVGGGAPDS